MHRSVYSNVWNCITCFVLYMILGVNASTWICICTNGYYAQAHLHIPPSNSTTLSKQSIETCLTTPDFSGKGICCIHDVLSCLGWTCLYLSHMLTVSASSRPLRCSMNDLFLAKLLVHNAPVTNWHNHMHFDKKYNIFIHAMYNTMAFYTYYNKIHIKMLV